jgi:hypothetical protein
MRTGENSEKLVTKIVLVALVFPIVVLVIYQLLLLPNMLTGYLLIHFGANPELCGRILPIITLPLACWGGFAVCKLVWPKPQ